MLPISPKTNKQKFARVMFPTVLVTALPEFYRHTSIPHVGCLLKKQLDHSLIQESLPVSHSLDLCFLKGSTPTKGDMQGDFNCK